MVRATSGTPWPTRADIVQRALCVVAALGLLILAANNFGVGVGSPWRAQISPLGFRCALGLVVASCSVRSARALNGVMLAVLGVAIALTAAENGDVRPCPPRIRH